MTLNLQRLSLKALSRPPACSTCGPPPSVRLGALSDLVHSLELKLLKQGTLVF